jgi:hypothetical protein
MIAYSAKPCDVHTAIGDDETVIAAFLLRPKRQIREGFAFLAGNA